MRYLLLLLFTIVQYNLQASKQIDNLQLEHGSIPLSHATSPLLPKVNPISGEYVEEEIDFEVAGCQPLSFRRLYGHMNLADRRYGMGWRINPEAFFSANFAWDGSDRFAALGEENGSVIYMASHNKSTLPDGREVFSYTLGDNSKYAYTNLEGIDPHNTVVYFWNCPLEKEKNKYEGFVQDGAGGIKKFWTPEHKWDKNVRVHMHPREWVAQVSPQNWIPYHVLFSEERLPNGNYLIYEYKKWQDEIHFPQPRLLSSVTAYNADKTKILGELEFHYNTYDWHYIIDFPHPRHCLYLKRTIWEVKDYSVKSNELQLGSYQHTSANKGRSPVCLQKATTVDEDIHYSYDKQGRLIKIDRGDGRIFQTEYDAAGKVSVQKGPYGQIGRYVYHNGFTEIFDAENNRTVFHYDDKKRLTAIEKPDVIERFKWDAKSRLQEKTVEEGGKPIYKQLYVYDERGNCLEETLVGNLTGSGQEECYTISRTFSDDVFNLKLSETDHCGKTTYYSYHPDTNLIATEKVYLQDQLLYTNTFEYDDCAVCTQKTVEADGYRKVTLISPKQSLPCFGLPEVVKERAGDTLLSKIRYTYHPSGKIESEEHYDSMNVLRYTLHNTYDTREHLISSTDALGQTTTYVYDQQNNRISQTGAYETLWEYDLENHPVCEKVEDLEKRWTYDRLGRVIAETDYSGHVTRYAYDYAGRPIQTEHPDGGIEKKNYDALGNVVQEIDPKGYLTTKKYNSRSQITDILYPDGSEEHFRYHLNGTLASHTDKNGLTTTYTYDALGRLIKEEASGIVKTKTYSAFTLLSETDEEGVTTYYSYDLAGRKVAEKKGALEITYDYDTLGRVHRIEKPFTVLLEEYDDLNRVIEKRTEDKQGTIIFQEDYRYDEDGNQTHLITCAGVQQTLFNAQKLPIQIISPEGETTTISYSYPEEFVKTIHDPDGVTHAEVHDPCGRVKSIQTCNPETIQHREFAYDLAGNCVLAIEHIYERATPIRLQKTAWEYGPLNRIERLIESDLKETRYLYDDKGRLSTLIKPDKNKIHYSYDIFGRLHNLSALDIDDTYTYDKKGRMIAVSDGTERSYDIHDHIIDEKLANGYRTKYTYDAEGKLIKLHLPDGSIADYAYNADKLSHVSYKGQITAYQRNLSGRPVHITTPVGEIHFEYDASLRLISMLSPYYSALDYRYDPAGCLTHYTYVDPIGSVDLDFSYDPLRQLIAENDYTYSYDSLYNRVAKDTTRHTLNELSQLTDDGVTKYDYDPNGNLIQAGSIHLSYDALDRLIGVSINGKKYTYTYDAFNRRLSKRTPKETIRYIWQIKNEIGSSKGELRILGEGLGAEIGATVFIQLTKKLYVPFHDQRGALTVLVDLKGKPVETVRYTAFGEELTNTAYTPWHFASKRLDPETGYLYFSRRYYSPSFGRWITPDPQGFADGPNLYAYVANTPLFTIDLYGEWGCPRWLSSSFEFAFPVTHTALHLPADTPGWKRGAYLFGGGAEIALMGIAPFAKSGATLAGRTIYQVSKSAMARSAERNLIRSSEKALGIATERKIVTTNFANKSTNVPLSGAKNLDLDALSKAGQVMDREGLTRAGRALDKHGNRFGSPFPKATGNPASKNMQGQFHLDDILTDPSGRMIDLKGGSRQFYSGDGRGIHFRPDGSFKGFLDY